ncbi:hypothetical protein [[Mycoplasma] collis]|uniref:hypothetical protein n=1 Tax=[Mycoplasma] collis TaxID=2127 RepID=UPI00051C994E|nr:hypothetical protein [[Mycoplasma] collis]
MFKKIKKISKIFLLVSPLAALTAIGCAAKNPYAESKEIFVAREGVQKSFWDSVVENFSKTQSYKDGYRIKFVEKDVFGAIDQVTTVGFNDSNSPDLIYSPQDRITSLLQSKSIRPWDVTVKDQILNDIGANDDEKTFINEFGKFQKLSSNSPEFYNFAHNKEGIVLMTKKSLEEVKKDFSDTKTDEMVELVKEGKAFFRIQDGWFGNGILGGVLNEELMKKIIYKKEDGNWSSGFLTSDANNVKFKEALDIAAELMYPIYEAVYVKTAEEYKNSPFGKKGISQDDLKTLLSSNMEVVQNKVLELISSGKLEYGMVGSWDIGNSFKQGIETFVAFPKLKNNYHYKQAAGSWSWAINARNQGVNQKRLDAIYEILKIIFKSESYAAYFKQDSKIPLVKNTQTSLETLIISENKTHLATITKLAKDLGYSTNEEFLNAYDNLFKKLNETLDKKLYKDSWSFNENTSPLDNSNIKKDTIANVLGINDSSKSLFFGITDALFNEIKNLKLKDKTGLRNFVATILKIDNINDLKGSGNEEWQVNPSLVKVTFDEELHVEKNTNQNAHIRLIENKIFGMNGDNESTISDFIKSFHSEGVTFDSKVIEFVAKAKEFSTKYAKTTVEDATIKKAVELYLANFYNQVMWEKLQKEYKKVWTTSKFNKKDKTASEETIEAVNKKVDTLRSGNVSSKVINVLTSNKTFNDNGYGIIQYQKERIGNANPQFGGAWWDIWNNQLFGNAKMYEDFQQNVKTEAAFKTKINEKIQSLYTEKVNALNSSQAEDFIAD